jgi:hypothetical protein
MLNQGANHQVANQATARSGGAKPAPAEGGGAGGRLGGGDGGGGGGSWSASPVRPAPGTPPLPEQQSWRSLGQGGAAAREAAPQLLLHASMDLQLELLRSLHVRRSHIGAWLKQPTWLPGGPRGLLVKVKANMGHNSTEYVVAEIVQACADGRLELKAPSGALNQTPGEPCWYPHEFVSNGAMQRHELLLAPTPTLTPTLNRTLTRTPSLTPTPSLAPTASLTLILTLILTHARRDAARRAAPRRAQRAERCTRTPASPCSPNPSPPP